jgi:hypothetical protein
MRPVCSEFVAANTTNCYQLAAAAGINLQQFLDFNKNVHDNCDNVLVGKKVRIPWICTTWACLSDWFPISTVSWPTTATALQLVSCVTLVAVEVPRLLLGRPQWTNERRTSYQCESSAWEIPVIKFIFHFRSKLGARRLSNQMILLASYTIFNKVFLLFCCNHQDQWLWELYSARAILPEQTFQHHKSGDHLGDKLEHT